MPASRSLLRIAGIAGSLAALAAAPARAADEAAGPPIRLLFVGDVMLSRQVAAEVAATSSSPFAGVAPLFRSASFVAGNLEGALGSGSGSDCPGASDEAPCFAIPPALLDLAAAASLDALSLENNHAGDLGGEGRDRTAAALTSRGILPLTFEESPVFVEVAGHSIALVALSTVPARDGSTRAIPSWELARKLRLARALGEVVVVLVHWGAELVDFARKEEREAAAWLARQGVDLVIGSHPHVVQPPACVEGAIVFYSLGNHVFDQRYPETKEGLVADCRLDAGGLSCAALATRTRRGSSRPELAGKDPAAACTLPGCSRAPAAPLQVSGITIRPRPDARGIALEGRDAAGRRLFLTPPIDLLAIQPIRVQGDEALFTVERHASPIDGEAAPRPYVYRVTAGGLFALWRGSALAWPLLDAVWLPDGPGTFSGRAGTSPAPTDAGGCLCALHRADSFLAPALDPAAPPGRTAGYRWNGFGFSGLEDPVLDAACRARFQEALPR